MAVGGKVKGITIEFNGDTTKLGNALKQIDSKSKSVDRSLQQVNRALRFNPKNTELVAQKQTLLAQKINQTRERLVALENTQKKLDDDPSVEKDSQEYMELRREIITTESKLQHFEAEQKKLNNIKFTNLGNAFQKVGGKMSAIGQTMSMYVTGPIVAGFAVAGKSASDYEENINKIDVAFGKSGESVKQWAKTANKEFGLSQVAATGMASAFGALGKGIGLSEKDAASMSTTLTGLSADLGSYFNTSEDEAAKALEGIFTGESEALKKFGVVMTDTNLKQFAADQGLVWDNMSQAEKTTLRYKYVLEKTKDAQGDFSRTGDGTANSIKKFKSAVQDVATAIGQNLLPIITPIINKIAEWIGKFRELDPKTQKIITILGMVAAAVGPLLLIFGKFATAIGAIIKILPALKTAMATAFGPWGLLIAGVIAAAILLYKNWDKVKKFLLKIWNAIKKAFLTVFNAIKTALVTYWKTIWTITKTIWGTIFKALKAVWNAIKKAALVVWNAIKTAIVAYWKFLWKAAKLIWGTIFNVLKTIWNAIKTAALVVWNAIKKAITTYWKIIWTVTKTIWGTIFNVLKTIWNAIKTAASVVLNAIVGLFKKAWAAIKTAWSGVKSFFIGIWNGIKSAFANVGTWFSEKFRAAAAAIKSAFGAVKSFFSGVWSKIKGAFGNVAGFFKGKFSAAWTAIKNVFHNVASFFGGIWGKIKEKFTSLGSKIGSAIGGAVAAGINGIIGFIERTLNKGIGLINGAIKLINKVKPGKDIGQLSKLSLPRISWHKKGGIFDSPSVIGVGEAGAEAVVPLNKFWDKLDKMAEGASSPIVVNVYGSENMNVNELAVAVQNKIIQLQKRKNSAWA